MSDFKGLTQFQNSNGLGVVVIDPDGNAGHPAFDIHGKPGSPGPAQLLVLKGVLPGEPASQVLKFNAGNAELQLGGSAKIPGKLSIFDAGETCVLKFEASSGILSIGTGIAGGQVGVFPPGVANNSDLGKATIHLRGTDGTIRTGGAGHGGLILLLPQTGGTQVRLTADDTAGGQAGLFPPGAKSGDLHDATIHLRGTDGTIRTGGAGVPGRVLVLDKNNNVALTLDGASGDIILQNADCAEDFDVVEGEWTDPGTVMVLDSGGSLRRSAAPYDKKVAGVISGGGDYRPGIVLDKQPSKKNRQPLALMGKAYCKVDAQYSPIAVGDMVTTSLTPGHAMKASDPLKAFGAVIGKALRPLQHGQAMIPILIALQ